MRLTILGGGPGGYTAAFAAQERGITVTLVEKSEMGGTCLNCGCIPTKTLRASADTLLLAKEMGVGGLDLERVRARKEKVIATLRSGLEKSCAARNIRVIRGEGHLVDAHTVAIRGTEEQVQADATILATGSRVLNLPGLPIDHTYICSSDDALRLTDIPKRLVIVGGGVIGCEMACIYRAFGSEVTIVEGQQNLLPMPSVDQEVRNLLARELRKQKITVHLGSTVTDVRVQDGCVQGSIAPSPFVPATGKKAEPLPCSADMILVTVGRAPATEALGLKRVGIAQDARGWIQVDAGLATNVPDVYAIGDVLGPKHCMLAHVAAAEALCVVDRLTGRPHDMCYDVVPSAIFTYPEIAEVGLSEDEAKQKGLDIIAGTTLMRELGKAQAMGELPGFFKLLADKTSGRILGAHIVGAHASDIIAEATLAVQQGLTVRQVAETIHAHPTLAEGLYEAARSVLLKTNS